MSIYKNLFPINHGLTGTISNYIRAPGWLSWLSVRLLVSPQVAISRFVELSPAPGSVLRVALAWDSLSPSSLPLLVLFLSLSK